MDLRQAERKAREEMSSHGLTAGGWKFTFDQAKTRLGRTNFRTQTISLSAPLIELNDREVVLNTILHEIAHVLAGPYAGHGPVWQNIATSLGCSAQRTVEAIQPVGTHIGTCPNCGETSYRYRAPRGKFYCTVCPGTTGTKFYIEWT